MLADCIDELFWHIQDLPAVLRPVLQTLLEQLPPANPIAQQELLSFLQMLASKTAPVADVTDAAASSGVDSSPSFPSTLEFSFESRRIALVS